MRAQYRETRSYAGRQPTEIDLRAAARACRFRGVEFTTDFARLRCGINWWSFGENIEVHVALVGEATIVDVHSVCLSPTQLEDWGKNRKNVRRLFEALGQQLGESVASDVPACAKCGYLLVGIASETCPECGGKTDEIPPRSLFTQKLRSAAIAVVVLSTVEILILMALQAAKLIPVLHLFSGIGGMIWVLATNSVAMLGVLLLARVWKSNR